MPGNLQELIDIINNQEVIEVKRFGQVRSILHKSPELASAKDKCGNTALHHAANFTGYSKGKLFAIDTLIFTVLLHNDADINARNDFGVTPLILAAKNHFAHNVEFLITNGADVNAQDKKGKTALHHAVKHERSENVKKLLKHNININAENFRGENALDIAVKYVSNEDIAEVLLDNGARIEGDTGRSLLFITAETENKELAEKLLGKGVDVNIRYDLNRTALHCAAEHGHKDMVEVLVNAGADITAKNENGETPLDLDRENGHQEIITLLEEAQKAAQPKSDVSKTVTEGFQQLSRK